MKYALITINGFKQKSLIIFEALLLNTLSEVSQRFEIVYLSWHLKCEKQ